MAFLHAVSDYKNRRIRPVVEFSVRGHSTTTWTRRGGGGVSQKSTLVHSGGGGPLNVHVDQKPRYFRKHFVPL